MRHITDLLPSVSRLFKVSALGALSTVAVTAATMWLITGSPNPSAWLAAYDHARRCAVADAALSAGCTAAAAKPAVSIQESPQPTEEPVTPGPATSPPADEVPPPATPPAAGAPAPTAGSPVESETDDSGEGQDS